MPPLHDFWQSSYHTISQSLARVAQGDKFHIHFSEAPDNTSPRASPSTAVRKWTIAQIPTHNY